MPAFPSGFYASLIILHLVTTLPSNKIDASRLECPASASIGGDGRFNQIHLPLFNKSGLRSPARDLRAEACRGRTL